jgi:type I restriction enzyme, R subunit
MPKHVTEEQFETDIVESLVEQGGYIQGETKHFNTTIGLDTTELFAFIVTSQPKDWATLVKHRGGDPEVARTKFLARLVSELDIRGTIDVLRRGVEDQGVKVSLAFSKPASGLNETILKLYGENRLTVTRQLRYSGDHAGELDLGLFVNGIPVATAELKSPVNGQDVSHAIAQYQRDRDEPANATLNRRAVVHFAVDPSLVYMTTRLAGESTEFMPFNRGSSPGDLSCGKGNPPTPDDYGTSYLWETVWQYDNWLDILLRFAEEFYEGIGKAKKRRIIVPRFHQWDAVRRSEADALANGPGRSYLLQHSTGSGKSNSIAWLAHRLSVLHDPADKKIFDKVVVVTDRRVLDEQLSTTVSQFETVSGTMVMVQGKKGSKSKELADALKGQAKIVTVTLETFPFVIELIADADLATKSYAVIVDEAHSSQTGEAAAALKQALGAGSGSGDEEGNIGDGDFSAEDVLTSLVAHRGMQKNLSFFAFTATPKDRTVEIFGTPDDFGVKQPFHLYTMRQAIEEGFILDVLQNYTTYNVYFKIAAESEEVAAEEVEAHKGAAALKKFVKLHPTMIQEKAAIIVEHFREHTSKELGGRAKAMVVTDSRAAAVRYKRAVDHHIKEHKYQDILALVAFSGEIDGETESSLNGFPESQTAKRFKGEEPYKPGDFQVLIVAEKYQTGFDEPYLHTMFVDKKLKGLNAVQTLSRLNRWAPGKTATFVLDFCNEPETIQAAFQKYYEGIIIEQTDVNVLYDLRGRMLAIGILKEEEIKVASDAYFAVDPAKRLLKVIYSNIDPVLVRFAALSDDEQAEFRDALDQFIRAYSFLSQVMPFTDEDLERLYVYGKALAACLPSQATGSLDIGKDVVLTHLRIETKGVTDISLTPGQVEAGKVFSGEGHGSAWEDEKETLAAIIDAINERYGLDLDDRDRLEGEKLKLTLLQDPELETFARQNSMEHYSLEFTNKWKGAILGQEERNQRLYNLLLSNPELAKLFETAIMQETYEAFRNEDDPGDGPTSEAT